MRTVAICKRADNVVKYQFPMKSKFVNKSQYLTLLYIVLNIITILWYSGKTLPTYICLETISILCFKIDKRPCKHKLKKMKVSLKSWKNEKVLRNIRDFSNIALLRIRLSKNRCWYRRNAQRSNIYQSNKQNSWVKRPLFNKVEIYAPTTKRTCARNRDRLELIINNISIKINKPMIERTIEYYFKINTCFNLFYIKIIIVYCVCTKLRSKIRFNTSKETEERNKQKIFVCK